MSWVRKERAPDIRMRVAEEKKGLTEMSVGCRAFLCKAKTRRSVERREAERI